MCKINQVVIFLDVCDIEKTAEFYKTIFGFRQQKVVDTVVRLEKDNCILMLSKVIEPSITTFGLIVDDTVSLKKTIEQNGISHDYDSAKPEWQIKDASGNTISLSNNRYND